MSDDKRNFVKFTIAPDGARYVMTRPYSPPKAEKTHPLGCLAAPFCAVSGFVHFFCAVNAQRKGKTPPLSRAVDHNPAQTEDQITLDDVLVDAGRALRENEKLGEAYPGVAPRDWQLERLLSDGTREIVRRGVVDYAVLDGGQLAYTNGVHIVCLDQRGAARLMDAKRLVSALSPMPEGV